MSSLDKKVPVKMFLLEFRLGLSRKHPRLSHMVVTEAEADAYAVDAWEAVRDAEDDVLETWEDVLDTKEEEV